MCIFKSLILKVVKAVSAVKNRIKDNSHTFNSYTYLSIDLKTKIFLNLENESQRKNVKHLYKPFLMIEVLK